MNPFSLKEKPGTRRCQACLEMLSADKPLTSACISDFEVTAWALRTISACLDGERQEKHFMASGVMARAKLKPKGNSVFSIDVPPLRDDWLRGLGCPIFRALSGKKSEFCQAGIRSVKFLTKQARFNTIEIFNTVLQKRIVIKLNFFIDDYNTISIENAESLNGKKLRIVRGTESFDYHLFQDHNK